MDFNLQSYLDSIILDSKIGIVETRSPVQLSQLEFIGLINSDEASNIQLNHEIKGEIPSYVHFAKYQGIEFMTQTLVDINDL